MNLTVIQLIQIQLQCEEIVQNKKKKFIDEIVFIIICCYQFKRS